MVFSVTFMLQLARTNSARMRQSRGRHRTSRNQGDPANRSLSHLVVLLVTPFLLFLDFTVSRLLLIITTCLTFRALQFQSVRRNRSIRVITYARIVNQRRRQPILTTFHNKHILNVRPYPEVLLNSTI